MLHKDVWRRVPLSEVCSAIVDCVNKTAPTSAEPTPYKMIRTTNVRNGWVRLEEVRFVSEEVYKIWTRRQVPQRGDVILSREAPLGEVGMLRSDEKVFLGQRLMSYRANPEKLDNRFLLYSMQGDDIRAQVKSLGSGATVEHMRVPDAERMTIRLPILSTQRRIGGFLAAYDDLIENNTRRIAILEEMARALYREWFVELRFPEHSSKKSLSGNHDQYPVGWSASELGQLTDDVRAAVDPREIHPETPYFGLEHLPRRSIALSTWGRAGDVQSSKLQAKAGDILFGKIRPYFHKVGVCPFEAVCSSDTIVLRPKLAEHFGLVLACVSSDEFVAHATQTSQGTKMPRASWQILRHYPVAMPPPELNAAFNEQIFQSVELIRRLCLMNANLRATRDLLLPKLISGELDVSRLPEPNPGS